MVTVGLIALATFGCGGGVLSEAQTRSAQACACADLDCVRPHVKWFNEQSLKDKGAALKGLSTADQESFTALSVAAGDCQMKLKQPK